MKESIKWFRQRLSAVVLVFLVPIMWRAVDLLTNLSRAEIIKKLNPITIVILFSLIFCLMLHARIGLQSIYEDYLHGSKKIIANFFSDSLMLVCLIIYGLAGVLLIKELPL